LLSIQLSCDPTPYTAALPWAKCKPHCSVLLCKNRSQQACATAIAPMKMFISYS